MDANGSTVTLTLANSVNPGDVVTVSYAVPGSNPVEDVAGNDAAAFSNQAVTNTTGDTTPPTLTSAAIDDNILILTYDEALNGSSDPATGAYVVKVNGSTVTVNGVDASGSTVTLTLANPVNPGDVVTISYAVPGSSPVEDLAGNDAVAFSNQAVTNNTLDTTPPAAPNVAPDLTAASDSGFSNTDNITSDTTPTFTGGGGTAGDVVKIYDGTTLVGSGTVQGDGTWSVTTTVLAEGNHNITSTYTDPVGNESGASPALAVAIDLTAPKVTFNPKSTNDNTPQLGGTVDDPTATVQVTINGTTYNATNNGDGTWTLADDAITNALGDGSYNIVVRAIDPSGNIGSVDTSQTSNGSGNGAGGNQGLVVDNTAPNGTIEIPAATGGTNPDSVIIKFNEPVQNLDVSDLLLSRDGVLLSLEGAILTSTDGITWTLSNLKGQTSISGNYEISLKPENDVTDLIGNRIQGVVKGIWFVADTCQLGSALNPISIQKGRGGLKHKGLSNSDRLTGNTHRDDLIGLGGNDRLKGQAGNDRLRGGSGNDLLSGGSGSDWWVAKVETCA